MLTRMETPSVSQAKSALYFSASRSARFREGRLPIGPAPRPGPRPGELSSLQDALGGNLQKTSPGSSSSKPFASWKPQGPLAISGQKLRSLLPPGRTSKAGLAAKGTPAQRVFTRAYQGARRRCV